METKIFITTFFFSICHTNGSHTVKSVDDPYSGTWNHSIEASSLEQMQDGTLKLSWINGPPLCIISLDLEAICIGVLIGSEFILTAGACIGGINPFFRSDPYKGYKTNCGKDVVYGGGQSVRSVFQYYTLSGYNFLNITYLRRRDIGIVETDLPYANISEEISKDTKIHELRYPIWPKYDHTKRLRELFVYYKYCQIFYRDRDHLESPEYNSIFMVEAELITRDECSRREVFPHGDEFCLIIYSERSGSCKPLLGAPVICNGVLEGIMTLANPEFCHQPNRTFLATRVDNYMDFIYESMHLPITPKTDPPLGDVTASTTVFPYMVVAGVQLELWMIIFTAGWLLFLLVLGALLFIWYACHCEKLDRLNPRHRRKVEAAWTLSVNLIPPFFVLITRLVMVCRLWENLERGSNRRSTRQSTIGSGPTLNDEIC